MERSAGYATYNEYDPKTVQDIDFKVNIKESAESPVARMMLNDLVKELWMAGAISASKCYHYHITPDQTRYFSPFNPTNKRLSKVEISKVSHRIK